MKILWGAKFFWCPFFADVFFEMLCCGGGYQDWLFVAAFEMLCGWAGSQDWLFVVAFEMLCGGRGTKIGFAHLVPRLRGVTENKES